METRRCLLAFPVTIIVRSRQSRSSTVMPVAVFGSVFVLLRNRKSGMVVIVSFWFSMFAFSYFGKVLGLGFWWPRYLYFTLPFFFLLSASGLWTLSFKLVQIATPRSRGDSAQRSGGAPVCRGTQHYGFRVRSRRLAAMVRIRHVASRGGSAKHSILDSNTFQLFHQEVTTSCVLCFRNVAYGCAMQPSV